MLECDSAPVSGVAVLGYARTPFGRFGGTLRTLSLPVLGAVPVQEAIKRARLQAADVDEVVIGVNFPGSERSVARQVSLHSGIPENRPSYTVDRACCSSLAAVNLAGRGLRLGESAIAVAGGVDNLSRVPYFLEDMRFGSRLGDIVLKDQLAIACPHTHRPRAVQAGEEAISFDIGREEQDLWALRSQVKYAAASKAGAFDNEIVRVALSDQAGTNVVLDTDEVPRPNTTLEALSRLQTVYGSPTVTAGNAPNLSSGAAALVLASAEAVSDRNLNPVAWLSGWSMVSGDPHRIASIPAVAIEQSLKKTGIKLEAIEVIEINEAFAAVPLVTTLALAGGDRTKVNDIRERVNMWGGAIAVGHPTGATAARLVMTAISQLRSRGGGTGIAALCGGIGEAEAVVVHCPRSEV